MLRELNGSMGSRPASLAQTQSVVNGGEVAEDDSEEVTFDVKIEAGLGGRGCVFMCVMGVSIYCIVGNFGEH